MADATRAPDQLDRATSERLATLVTTATYGAVIVLGAVVLATPGNVRSGYGLEIVLGAGIATWVAHAFAELVGEQLRKGEPLDAADVRRAMLLASPILAAALLPALALVPGRFGWISAGTALWIAAAVGILELTAIAGLVAYVHRSRRVRSWRFVIAVTVAGIVVVAFKLSLGSH